MTFFVGFGIFQGVKEGKGPILRVFLIAFIIRMLFCGCSILGGNLKTTALYEMKLFTFTSL